MRILEPKNAFWKGAKKHGVKKVVESKNALYKSCQKFYILGDNFFSFWRNFKNEDSRAKKHFTDLHSKHVFLALEPPKSFFFSKKKLYRHYILTYWDDLEPFLIWLLLPLCRIYIYILTYIHMFIYTYSCIYFLDMMYIHVCTYRF